MKRILRAIRIFFTGKKYYSDWFAYNPKPFKVGDWVSGPMDESAEIIDKRGNIYLCKIQQDWYYIADKREFIHYD